MIVGHSLAASEGTFNWTIAILSVLTAVSLQVLSNFANDYGDSIHGADSEERTGPSRAVQTGVISSGQMKLAIRMTVIITLLLGLVLLYVAFDDLLFRLIFLALGLLAIWAAINYTAGKDPYGYRGKGDISVFVFFGLVTVLGSYFLQTKTMEWIHLFPAIACGSLSVGVLNINNIRDLESDRKAGKDSIPVKIGRKAAIFYHGLLILLAVVSFVLFGIIQSFGWSYKWLFLLAIPLLVYNFIGVKSTVDAEKLDPFLKQLALSSALLFILFSICTIYF